MFSPFELMESQKLEKRQQERASAGQAKAKIAAFVAQHRLVQLDCPYFGMETFFYDTHRKVMYVASESGEVSVSHDPLVLSRNGLS